jgi:hypothetical protein
MVGCGDAIHPEVRGDAIGAKLRENVMAEIPVERIFLRNMAEILHEGSILELIFFDNNSPLVRISPICSDLLIGFPSTQVSHE